MAAVQVVQSIATILAIIVGGIWTYWLFVEQRQKYPHLKVEDNVTQLPLPNHRIALLVDITPTNVGAVKATLTSGWIKVYALSPMALDDASIEQVNGKDGSDEAEPNALWEIEARRNLTAADARQIEPGESDRIHFEFVLSDDVGPLLVQGYFGNPTVKGTQIGWSTRSVYIPRAAASSTPQRE